MTTTASITNRFKVKEQHERFYTRIVHLLAHRLILCVLLKYTTFNEFSINFDWHFSLHTSLAINQSVFLSLSLCPRCCLYKCPDCGSSMKRSLRLGHVQMLEFCTWDFMLKSYEQTETQQHFSWKFKQSNNYFGFIISAGESTTGRHVKLTKTQTSTHTHKGLAKIYQ